MYDFLLDKKPAKIKKDTIIQQYEDGGLKMVEIEKFINQLFEMQLDKKNSGIKQ